MSFHHPCQSEFSLQGKMGISLMLAAFLALGACVPYPHSVTRNPAIEGRVLSAESETMVTVCVQFVGFLLALAFKLSSLMSWSDI